MKTWLQLLFLALLPTVLLAQEPCNHSEIILQLQANQQPEPVLRWLGAKWPAAKFELKETISKRFHAYLLGTACGQFTDLDLLRKEAGIASASWNERIEFRRDTFPNDTLFPKQWNLDKIRLPEVWPLAQGGRTPSGKEIVVAVIDNGFDLEHPDLQANLWTHPQEVFDGKDNDNNGYKDDIHGWNFPDSLPFFPITTTHGTNVLGIIGATGNNITGVAGVNWNVKLMLLHFIKETADVIKAMQYVLEMRERYNASGGAEGAFVVATNGSFGLKDPFNCSTQPLWAALYDSLGQAGIISVAATRNDPYNIDETGDTPTDCPSEYLVTVTASEIEDRKVDYAAFGKKTVDLAAPGDSIFTTTPGGGYRMAFSGASAACPHVAGTIALLYSLPCPELDALVDKDPAAAARLFRDAILKGVEKNQFFKNITATGGRLDAYGSMKYLHSYCIAKSDEREAGDFDETYIGGRGFVRLSPNPATDRLKIEYSITDFQRLTFRVFNILGQEMQVAIQQQAEPFEPQSFELNLSNWAAGTYILNIYDLGEKISAKFVKI